MDTLGFLDVEAGDTLRCVDMHTAGEPTRIIVDGYPQLEGTLLEQRAQARRKYDHIRRQLILEPRGHYDMYGALLRTHTEKTQSGEADIGVLFMTNDGYSTMCGHATIALGRFLINTHDLNVFPNREKVHVDASDGTATFRLHAPCGVLSVRVPTLDGGQRSDSSKPVSFVSVECFATKLGATIPLNHLDVWPELKDRKSVTVDLAYGGAFYCFITAEELGFNDLQVFDIDAMNIATRRLKAAVNANADMRASFTHPDSNDLSFLYSVIVTDKNLGAPLGDSKGAETGLCFFSDQEIDRSPTGSGVSARLAIAYAKKKLGLDEAWTYHSLVTVRKAPNSAFVGAVVEEVKNDWSSYPLVRTRVEGFAYYTGLHTFFVERADPLGRDGFLMSQLCK